MQQVQTRRLGSSGDSAQYAWGSDEQAMVSALMGVAWDHHVGRWRRIRMSVAGVLSAIGPARLFGR